MAKRALGRGLGALIKQIDDGVEIDKDKIIDIDIDLLDVNPYQPRKEFEEEHIISLAKSIKENQLLNPVTVKKNENKYIIISGERRFRACKYLNYKKIKCIVIDVDDKDLSIYSLLENIQRVDLNDIEKGLAAKNIKDKFNFTDEQLSYKLGVSRSTVTNYLRLLKLEDYVKDAINNNKITTGHGRVLIGLEKDLTRKIFDKIIKEKLSVRDVEKIVKDFKSLNNEKKKKNNPHIDRLRNHFENKFKNFKENKNNLEITLKFNNIVELKKYFNIDE